ncbi:vomeronasal type-1 receptor 4-like [Phyllostomus discolor]|uniref:Vomeronasal type-1 receptor n=1 Tax=Phyllostomus discolor TaxID=89673 RepID=A0A7E6CN14_9CHIR|nr:vomeronasal type-1 receptor 4-like [Phyllostomus discolor]
MCLSVLSRFYGFEQSHCTSDTNGMISVDLPILMLILAQTGIGIVGNALLFCHYICSLFRRHVLRPLEQIINHIALANTLVLLCGGLPQTMATFGMKFFLDDVGCKLVLYFQRVAWGSSLSITCLLGIFQALHTNPTNSRWAKLKFKSPKYVNSSCILSWIFHLLVNTIVPMRVSGPENSKNISMKLNLGHCSRVFLNTITETMCSVIFSSVDVICLGLMIWASGSMIFFLCRHKQQVQYIHRTRKSPQISSETRATKFILIFVSMFVLFYSLSSAFETWVYLFDNPPWRLVSTSMLLTSCFPTFSPFLLLKSDNHISSLCSFC